MANKPLNLYVRASMDEYGAQSKQCMWGYHFEVVDERTESGETEQRVVLTNPNGKTLIPHPVLNSKDRKLGKIEIDANGDLMIGSTKYLAGTNLIPGYTATRSINDSYNILDKDGKKYKATLGEYFPPLKSTLTRVDEQGNLFFEQLKQSVKLSEKTYRLSLRVNKDRTEQSDIPSGFTARLEQKIFTEKGSVDSSVNGVFVSAKKPGDMAYFYSKFNGINLCTALFKADPVSRQVTLKVINPKDAANMQILEKRKGVILNECQKFGISPKAHQEFCKIEATLEQALNAIPERKLKVELGVIFFGLPVPNRVANKSKQYHRRPEAETSGPSL